jgi:hypothetical protein
VTLGYDDTRPTLGNSWSGTSSSLNPKYTDVAGFSHVRAEVWKRLLCASFDSQSNVCSGQNRANSQKNDVSAGLGHVPCKAPDSADDVLRGKKPVFSPTFYTRDDHFPKTGSGQTLGESSKKRPFSRSAARATHPVCSALVILATATRGSGARHHRLRSPTLATSSLAKWSGRGSSEYFLTTQPLAAVPCRSEAHPYVRRTESAPTARYDVVYCVAYSK